MSWHGVFIRCKCNREKVTEHTLKGYLASTSEKLSTKKDLPQEVYLSLQPDHVPLWKRNISNKLAVEYRKLRVNRKGTPISTVVVRWIRRNKLASYNHQSVMEELSRFGTVESVDFIGRQTAIVVFRDIISACKVVNAFPAKPGERIQCVWHDKFMSEYRISDNRKKKSTGC
ncbi:hypothetical protein Y1Q_0008063 [Alligator mississippiensis]|uniref:RRM domain-containing protein n=1 Tax=Alligator mississippiensis TaxID=8496 RepID=A0A151NFR9_ALLMI|nr:hypothetical protein Y1Q_0008063 [Alligator mississippiensis]